MTDMPLRQQTYRVLDKGLGGSGAGAAVHGVVVGLILANVIAVILESVPWIGEPYATPFRWLEYLSVAVFTVEYAARLWSSVEHPPLAGLKPWRARLKTALTPGMLIDLLTILPFYAGLLLSVDLRFVVILRLFRFFKLARYSPGFSSLIEAIWSERRALGASLIIFLGALVMVAAAMHLAEQQAQPDKFATIPDAMWWAVITLTTVGYGDVYPVTPLGKLLAGMAAILGIVMLALPVGIIATAFAQHIQRRDFVVTWSMMAAVPLFARLEPSAVAELMKAVRSETYEPGAVICRAGEPADSMVVVAEGELAVEFADRHMTLGAGGWYGDQALLDRQPRNATVRARERVKLLLLDAEDLHLLMTRNPAIAAVVEEAARQWQADQAAAGEASGA
ncbi:cyclic nucleotide-gated ion channel [Phreatobacter sp.]|uniref:cyclic nucleotide-gated ion channel n=1 Tax=Phreatobacter sp. TaxID=1966341 RepID=UPI003F6E5781